MTNITVWMTGLSGSGKSTVAEAFMKEHPNWVLLDGDVLRKGLCSDLGFSVDDRVENMRRLRALCKLFNDNGKNVITAFISPIEAEREKAKKEIDNCCVVFCNTSLAICEDRDVKGLYKKARDGEIPNFTGIDSPFDFPKCGDLVLETEIDSVESCVNVLKEFIKDKSLWN